MRDYLRIARVGTLCVGATTLLACSSPEATPSSGSAPSTEGSDETFDAEIDDELSWRQAPRIELVTEEEGRVVGVESAASLSTTLESCPSHQMHPRAKVICRGVYAKHEHEIVFTNSAGNEWESLPELVLYYRVGGGSFKSKTEAPSDGQVWNNEKEYNAGCSRSCVYGVGYKHGCKYTSVTVCD